MGGREERGGGWEARGEGGRSGYAYVLERGGAKEKTMEGEGEEGK